MTRDEFFQRRAVMDFAQRVGITQCPPSDVPQPRQMLRRGNRSAKLTSAAHRLTKHPSEDGTAQPIRHRRLSDFA